MMDNLVTLATVSGLIGAFASSAALGAAITWLHAKNSFENRMLQFMAKQARFDLLAMHTRLQMQTAQLPPLQRVALSPVKTRDH